MPTVMKRVYPKCDKRQEPESVQDPALRIKPMNETAAGAAMGIEWFE